MAKGELICPDAAGCERNGECLHSVMHNHFGPFAKHGACDTIWCLTKDGKENERRPCGPKDEEEQSGQTSLF
jgi:hypothetical protein